MDLPSGLKVWGEVHLAGAAATSGAAATLYYQGGSGTVALSGTQKLVITDYTVASDTAGDVWAGFGSNTAAVVAGMSLARLSFPTGGGSISNNEIRRTGPAGRGVWISHSASSKTDLVFSGRIVG